jgi:hypothetical protein
MSLIIILLVIITLGVLWPGIGRGCFLGLLALLVGLPILFFSEALVYNSGGMPWVLGSFAALIVLTLALAVRRQRAWERQ